MQDMLLIFNPRAGKGVIRSNLCEIIDVFTKGGYEVTVYPTQSAGDGGRKIIEDAEYYDMICVCGGDGTLSEAVGAMMQVKEKTPLGYIPAGSTNDVGSSLALSLNPVDCARDIAKGVMFDFDVGSFNGKNFVYVAAFGAFTDVSYETPQNVKNIWGHAAYVAEGLKRINKIKGHNVTVEHDGGTFSGNFVLGLVSNSSSVGGMRGYIKNVVYDDGLFEVCFVKTPKDPIELSSLLTEAAINKMSDRNFVTFKTSKLRIFSEEELPWTLDGESGGRFKRVEIKNLKQAIRLKVPFNDITKGQEFSRQSKAGSDLLSTTPEEYFRSQEKDSRQLTNDTVDPEKEQP